jgi:hypothetical protein
MNSFDSSEENLSASTRYMALNLMIRTNKSIGIKSIKNKITRKTLIPSFTENEWGNLVQSFGRNVTTTKLDFEHTIITLMRKFRIPLNFYVGAKSKSYFILSKIKRKIMAG